MNVGEILGLSGGGLILLLSLIQIAPVKINPWTWIARKIGRAINGEVLDEIANIKKKQEEAREQLEKHIQDDDERDESLNRRRILEFNIKLMRNENYTHEYFTDVLQDIDEYERYCKDHPGYKNNRARLAIENIRRVYEEHMRKGDFLGGV